MQQLPNSFLIELQTTFLSEASEMASQLESFFLQLEKNPRDMQTVEAIFRIMHTLKGSANSVNFLQLGSFAHCLESLLERIKKQAMTVTPAVIDVLLAASDRLRVWIHALKLDPQTNLAIDDALAQVQALTDSSALAAPLVPAVPVPANAQGWGLFSDHERPEAPKAPDAKPSLASAAALLDSADESIRLPMSKIEALLDLFGEQAILQASLEQARLQVPSNEERTDKIISQLSKITFNLQHSVMSLRMLSLTNLFHKMQRIVRDTAKTLQKDVSIESFGEDTELDKSVIDALSGAVTHILRNAIDHGIESPAERAAAGKPTLATITIRARHESGQFLLSIADDGRGLDRQKIRLKAAELGLIRDNAEISDEQIYKLIFQSGFSTAQSVTDVSGRGIGMDAVKTTVERLRGDIRLHSVSGQGTTVTIKLPLSMAIFNGMVFRLANDRYILPSQEISQVIRYEPADVHRIDEGHALLVQGERNLRLLDFRTMFDPTQAVHAPEASGRRLALVVQRNNKEFALEVDEIIGQQRVVLKKLGRELENFPNVSGGAILGDGKVAMILNLDAIDTSFTEAV